MELKLVLRLLSGPYFAYAAAGHFPDHVDVDHIRAHRDFHPHSVLRASEPEGKIHEIGARGT